MRWSKERVRERAAARRTPRRARRASPNRRRARREHLRALVDAGHAEAAPHELGCDEPGSGRDVEHVPAVPAAAARRGSAASADPGRSESAAPTRSYDGPSGANSSRASTDGTTAYCGDVAPRRRAGACRARLRPRTRRARRRVRSARDRAGAGAARLPLLDRRRGRDARLARRPRRRRRSVTSRARGARGGRRSPRSARSPRTRPAAATSTVSSRSLAELREREAPEGIEDAEAAARALRDVIGEPPQLATPARLDEIGVATRRLERELDPGGASPFAAALKACAGRGRRAPARGRGRLPGRRSRNLEAMEGSGGSSRSAAAIPRISSARCASSPSSRPRRCRRRSASSSRR